MQPVGIPQVCLRPSGLLVVFAGHLTVPLKHTHRHTLDLMTPAGCVNLTQFIIIILIIIISSIVIIMLL